VAIVPRGVEDLVIDCGFARVIALDWWESTEDVAPLRVTMTPAKHWGARMFNDTHRGFGGYVLEDVGGESARVYHSGDSAYFGGFAEVGERLKPDVALLPIGAYFPDSYRSVHTSPEEALRAFVDLGANVMVPMHYNTFRLGREPMDEPLPRLLKAAERAGVPESVVALGEGETWLTKEVENRK
jgi:L-ascorbate metabolism protein UlaG (beta-lactamase superfamily)